MSAIYPNQTLTPSEVVFLAADQFLAKAPLPKNYLITFQTSLFPLVGSSDDGVSKQPLAELECMAAVLALEAAGTIRLEARATKALLGLRTLQSLFASPAAPAAGWPEASLEGAIQAMAFSLSPAGQNDIANIIFRLFPSDQYDPFGCVCEWVRNGLARRGLLTANPFQWTQPARDAAAAQFPEVKALLVACQHGQAQTWDLLHTHVYQPLKRREAHINNI